MISRHALFRRLPNLLTTPLHQSVFIKRGRQPSCGSQFQSSAFGDGNRYQTSAAAYSATDARLKGRANQSVRDSLFIQRHARILFLYHRRKNPTTADARKTPPEFAYQSGVPAVHQTHSEILPDLFATRVQKFQDSASRNNRFLTHNSVADAERTIRRHLPFVNNPDQSNCVLGAARDKFRIQSTDMCATAADRLASASSVSIIW